MPVFFRSQFGWMLFFSVDPKGNLYPNEKKHRLFPLKFPSVGDFTKKLAGPICEAVPSSEDSFLLVGFWGDIF